MEEELVFVFDDDDDDPIDDGDEDDSIMKAPMAKRTRIESKTVTFDVIFFF